MTDENHPPAASYEKPPLKNRIIRWSLIGLAGFLALVILLVVLFYLRGRSTVNATADITPPTTNVPTDSASIAHGERIAWTRGCMECHGERLEGKVMADVPPALIVAPNLTRGVGGVGSRYSAVDWDRAVRYGVRPDRSVMLPMMPYEYYNRLNDADMASLAAFLASRPAVDNEVPPTRVKTFGYVMFGMGGIPRDGLDRPRSIITPGPTAEYGAYIASTTCVACHGPRLEGQKQHGSLTPGLHGYGAMETPILTRALREGLAADGRQLDPEAMPWRGFRHFDDTEIAALHAYLRALSTNGR